MGCCENKLVMNDTSPTLMFIGGFNLNWNLIWEGIWNELFNLKFSDLYLRRGLLVKTQLPKNVLDFFNWFQSACHSFLAVWNLLESDSGIPKNWLKHLINLTKMFQQHLSISDSTSWHISLCMGFFNFVIRCLLETEFL